MVNKELLEYFRGNSLAASVWMDKYQLKDNSRNPLESTPDDMHLRMAKEFGRIEFGYKSIESAKAKNNLSTDKEYQNLSVFGKKLLKTRLTQTQENIVEEIYSYFKDFKYIIPQGSVMANLGNPYVIGSLSNCFTIDSPHDSYGGIFHADQETGQLMKRRGGVGNLLDTLRPHGMTVTNAARTTSGVVSFAERYSNTTREVALDGRRGALMLLLSVKHPEIFRFITMKKDRTKVTGANVSVKFSDKFMEAVESNSDFLCTFPVNVNVDNIHLDIPYNVLHKSSENVSIMKIKASELFDEFITMAHDNAEPGAAYEDTIINYSPDGVYKAYLPDRSNPCSEIWMSANDACRLIAINLFSFVKNRFTTDAEIDFEKLYEVCYMQQRLGDNLVDLEIEAIDKILCKIENDPEPEHIKTVEKALWIKIKNKANEGRRTGSGLTAIGDMLAALNIKYSSDKAIILVNQIMQTKMEAELDCTIDMSILRGSFIGWDSSKEFEEYGEYFKGKNSFYEMLVVTFTEQARRMKIYGRRNVNWSTVAPTGTVSLMTQTTSGLEPVFKAYYIRRVKILGNTNKKVDFVDQNGDKWTEHAVLHNKFADWCSIIAYKGNHTTEEISTFSKDVIETLFKQSPWYGSESADIDWEYRIKMQAIIQKYTSNAISSTVNLPNDVSKETVKNIYIQAWKQKLKGITIYRDGSRSGVLVSESATKPIQEDDKFEYKDAPKRPKELEANYFYETYKGSKYAVIVGLLENNPYEIFVYENPQYTEKVFGKIIKLSTGVYNFIGDNIIITNLGLDSKYPDETMLTRWASMLLRHRVSPKFIAEQVEKSKVSVISFSKVLTRVLKTYILDEVIDGESCPSCNEKTMAYQEGCKRCNSCGYSKC